MKAILNNIRISPKKANLVAGIVRGAMVDNALNQLRFMPKKAAGILFKVIQSAAANAQNNNKMDRSKLFIKEIVVNKGPQFRRGVPVSRGRMHPRRKPTANITVIVDDVNNTPSSTSKAS